MWQCKSITLVSGAISFSRVLISVLLVRSLLILSFTIDNIWKLRKYQLDKIKTFTLINDSLKLTNIFLLKWLFWKNSAALTNSREPACSVTIIEYLYHSYLLSRLIMASAWWWRVGANCISLLRGECFNEYVKRDSLKTKNCKTWINSKLTVAYELGRKVITGILMKLAYLRNSLLFKASMSVKSL